MKERPIIFSTEMVKAILDGRKTQTRRVIKFKPEPNHVEEFKETWTRLCPYGQVGDRLWVRESWSVSDGSLTQYYIYKADGQPHPDIVDSAGHRSKGKWQPSIFMPRWASRITLEITEVRVERLQEMTEADAKTEGVICCPNAIPDYRHHFMVLWDSLNAKRGYGWTVNPWVWVIDFKKL